MEKIPCPFDDAFVESWSKIWNDSCASDMSYATFAELADDEMCTDWNKMDKHGDSFVEYWRSNDPRIRENAWDLTRDTNIWHLYQLPFPKRLVIATITLGCNTRKECVDYSERILALFQQTVAGLLEYNHVDPLMPTLQHVVHTRANTLLKK